MTLESWMTKPYTVALENAGAVPSAQRISAEVRFITALERAFGSADDVARVYRAWVDASENQASDVDAESAQLAVRWPRAFDTARQAGMREIGELPEAHFTVRLERAHAL
jgi:hypothetical protein